MMSMVKGIAKDLIGQATPEEKEVFDKIFRSSEEQVQGELGVNKDKLLGAFITVWAQRRDEYEY